MPAIVLSALKAGVGPLPLGDEADLALLSCPAGLYPVAALAAWPIGRLVFLSLSFPSRLLTQHRGSNKLNNQNQTKEAATFCHVITGAIGSPEGKGRARFPASPISGGHRAP
jgi:hypothetical protein